MGGTNEVIENNVSGLIIQASSPEAITKSILSLLEDTKMKIAFENYAYESVNKKFSWKNSCEKFIDIIKK